MRKTFYFVFSEGRAVAVKYKIKYIETSPGKGIVVKASISILMMLTN